MVGGNRAVDRPPDDAQLGNWDPFCWRTRFEWVARSLFLLTAVKWISRTLAPDMADEASPVSENSVVVRIRPFGGHGCPG
jgi:hypothetical protein